MVILWLSMNSRIRSKEKNTNQQICDPEIISGALFQDFVSSVGFD